MSERQRTLEELLDELISITTYRQTYASNPSKWMEYKPKQDAIRAEILSRFGAAQPDRIVRAWRYLPIDNSYCKLVFRLTPTFIITVDGKEGASFHDEISLSKDERYVELSPAEVAALNDAEKKQ